MPASINHHDPNIDLDFFNDANPLSDRNFDFFVVCHAHFVFVAHANAVDVTNAYLVIIKYAHALFVAHQHAVTISDGNSIVIAYWNAVIVAFNDAVSISDAHRFAVVNSDADTIVPGAVHSNKLSSRSATWLESFASR